MSPMSRRTFLRSAGVAAAALWTPAFRVGPGQAASCPAPAGFPDGIELYRQGYENWAGEIVVDDLWTCAPETARDVVRIANWALADGYRVRPRGMNHNWSPLTVTPGVDCANVILVDTTQHLRSMTVGAGDPPSVTVQAGATMEALLTALEEAGLGITTCPAPGDITVGGALAIDGHGAAIPAAGETRPAGRTYGSLSNLVLSLTAVVWDPGAQTYVLRTFERSDPACAALLVHLGRAFITEVTLQVGANDNLRCVSYVDVPAAELFAPADAGRARTLGSFVEDTGRAEAIWFPFTEKPWLKVWSVSPTKPAGAREVDGPYNYPFSDNVPRPLAQMGAELVRGNGESTPLFGNTMYNVVAAGLAATRSADIWGPSKNTLLYIKPTTMPVTANGYAVLTRRDHIQRVVSDFVERYMILVEVYRMRGSYPANMPVEIRATGLDQPSEVDLPGAGPPSLSALTPRLDHPEWDVAVWFDVLSLPGTPDASAFYQDLEAWMFERYDGEYATVRPEWSKGWAYSQQGAWSNRQMLKHTIPDAYRTGRPAGARWDDAVATLDALDPHRIFSNDFLDALLG